MNNLNSFGVIFDMDGVIFDTQKLIYEAEEILFNELHLLISKEQHESYAVQTIWELWRKLKEKYPLKGTVDQLVKHHREFGFDYIKQKGAEPIAGVSDLLVELVNEQIPIALATSGWKTRANWMLNNAKLYDFFTVVIYGDDVKNSKPHPDIFLAAAKAIKIQPEKCIVIEDSSNGILAAKNGNMYACGFRNQGSGKQNLDKADYVFDNFKNMSVKILKKIALGTVAPSAKV